MSGPVELFSVDFTQRKEKVREYFRTLVDKSLDQIEEDLHRVSPGSPEALEIYYQKLTEKTLSGLGDEGFLEMLTTTLQQVGKDSEISDSYLEDLQERLAEV